MAVFEVDNCELFVHQFGEGDEAVVFSPGLFLDHRQFTAQAEALSDTYRCIVYDHRNQGRSGGTETPMVDLERLYFDAASLVGALETSRCHFVGASTLGGGVGLRLAARRPGLLSSLTLIGASARPDSEETTGTLDSFATIANTLGIGVVAFRKISHELMPLLFGEPFLEGREHRGLRNTWRDRLREMDRSVTKSIAGAGARGDMMAELPSISCPTLVLHGDCDRMISSQEAVRLERTIPRGRLRNINGAGNTPTIEEPAACTAALRDFLAGCH